MKDPLEVLASALVPGDHIRTSLIEPYNHAMVVKVDKDNVYLVRPYMTCADFIYGDDPQVIEYTGHEHYSIARSVRVVLVRPSTVKELKELKDEDL